MNLIYIKSIYIILNLSFLVTSTVTIQDSWHLLADVSIEKKWDDLLQEEVSSPVFGEKLLENEGKEIELNGYMVPLDDLTGQNYFVLSSLPFQTCFFCGGAGPETVAEINTLKSVPFTDKKIKVKGTLNLNSTDPLNLYYSLKNAKVSY